MRLLIGFGGNEGDVRTAFAHAAARLRDAARVLACSGIWCSAPEGPPQADFLNAAVLVEVGEHPLALLALCQRLESEAGRRRSARQRSGPRPLDLDLLIAPGLVISSAALELPHPRLAGRRFALAPAAELVPEWVHPRRRRPLGALAAEPDIAHQLCERLGPFPSV